MQNEPDAADLLAVIAEVLEQEVVPQLTGTTQHHARVAANLVAILERELRLAGANDEQELRGLSHLLSNECPSELAQARTMLALALRDGLGDDPHRYPEIWSTLVEVVSNDLAVSKPGHDQWKAD